MVVLKLILDIMEKFRGPQSVKGGVTMATT